METKLGDAGAIDDLAGARPEERYDLLFSSDKVRTFKA